MRIFKSKLNVTPPRIARALSGFQRTQTVNLYLNPYSKLSQSERFVALAAGNNHLLTLTSHGRRVRVRYGEDGQLGRKIIGRRKINGTVTRKGSCSVAVLDGLSLLVQVTISRLRLTIEVLYGVGV